MHLEAHFSSYMLAEILRDFSAEERCGVLVLSREGI